MKTLSSTQSLTLLILLFAIPEDASGQSTHLFPDSAFIDTYPEDIHVTPNPFKNVVHLQSDQYALREVKVYRANGDFIFQVLYDSPAYADYLSFALLPKGWYVIEIRVSSGNYKYLVLRQ